MAAIYTSFRFQYPGCPCGSFQHCGRLFKINAVYKIDSQVNVRLSIRFFHHMCFLPILLQISTCGLKRNH
ncbi:hypothetical protein DXN05_05070 [Deminuibacter soli]|uniref:Uncharacterized protein n=1 Tax=Deminuibacter soli TaxID=2291815 RepID=A0A3E1NQX2_9BACT|nr:hypothetical protein DXN05_05070 [Deminuibacter soli]